MIEFVLIQSVVIAAAGFGWLLGVGFDWKILLIAGVAGFGGHMIGKHSH